MNEHETFQRLIENLTAASSDANLMGQFRSDQRNEWELVSTLLGQVRDNVFQIAMKRAN